MPIEITFGRSLKVLWSFAWRGMVMQFPLMFVFMGAMFLLGGFPKQGQDPQQIHPNFGLMMIIWMIMMTSIISIHILAMKWALQVKWMDFKLIAVSSDEA